MISLLPDFKTIIQEVPGYDTVFHSTIIEQHKQFYCYNKMHDGEVLRERDRQNFLALNVANMQLGRFFKQEINRLADAGCDWEPVETLRGTLQRWQDTYNAGGTFDTYRFAEEIYGALDSCGYPISERMATATDLHHAFINIPNAVKSFFQMTVLVPESGVRKFFNDIITYFTDHKAVAYYLKEFTVYQSLLRITDAEADDPWYVVKIVLMPDLVNTPRNPIIRTIARAVSERLGGVDAGIEINPYAIELADNVFIAQGSTNYKKFLRLIGILDKVYRQESDYAYLR